MQHHRLPAPIDSFPERCKVSTYGVYRRIAGDHVQVDDLLPSRDDAEVSRMTALGGLIEAASRANHGRSMQQAADLATSRGAPISKSSISESARGIDTITPKVIRGIAAGYDIPEEDVARAMLVDLGIVINDYSPDAESAIRRDPDLSTDARAILLAAISAARTSADGVGNDPEKPPGRRLLGRRQPAEEPGVGRGQKTS
jgi:hypothetical protein